MPEEASCSALSEGAQRGETLAVAPALQKPQLVLVREERPQDTSGNDASHHSYSWTRSFPQGDRSRCVSLGEAGKQGAESCPGSTSTTNQHCDHRGSWKHSWEGNKSSCVWRSPVGPAAARKLHSKRDQSWLLRDITDLKLLKLAQNGQGGKENVSLRQESLQRNTLLPSDFILWCYRRKAEELASRALCVLSGAEQQGTDGADLPSFW